MKQPTTLKIPSLSSIHEVAKQFINQMGDDKIFAFYGKLGAGKTTLIKGICKELGVKEMVNSPTFSMINEYETKEEEIIYHFDCYRINKIQEALDIGAEDYFYSGKLCFIEWPENIEQILPDSTIKVYIEEKENQEREVKIIKPSKDKI
ncbi:MAG TPA: tRNA (adenosine(37)-N6)-threonylcarbamoyltransferase complex ATPase subunit type 1 TsaE [Paludibacteraceae bacterium]|nr:tRNA (adenosine(37)-N6)-threonylcarbamoyltransferase complex ATPase subunit type 1 TsaE [Paludibacteraceae bacterium]HOL00686.1 tRNA (adenosine(37)-N6)-threonylcarbamoyltransferase complex ATPase subunit type 1 TsaE [Paludibacteraceae bacterium]HPO67529.1 tRNA (adenosine(37)-N6)-threonylcarbamoyltransferase complex ATPase subunit type 1 TsaE [Paludibacteraceae bacterium]HRU63720.1 tRNA (adenosine(37)-N6)-threonylcarbamoyltransferase complex ATPase subunit type 1 TsaE [Paludibacteraceae bacter